ncbi:MAG: sulfatase-like hydrolase/transferase, partial [Planctomycetota bacterium]
LLVFGLLAVAFSKRTLDAAQASRPAPARGLVLLLTMGLFASALSGWPISESRFLPQLGGESLGLLGTWPFVLGAAFLLALLIEGWNRLSSGRGSWLGSLPVLALALGGFGFAAYRSFAVSTPQMPIRVTQRELLSGVKSLDFVTLPPQLESGIAAEETTPGEWFAETSRQVITPAIYKEYDVGDKLSLLLPPGTTVAFDVQAVDGPVRLQAAAGAALEGYEDRPESTLHFIRYEVTVNGSTRFDETLRLQGDVPPAERVWRHLEEEGERGLALQPGDRVELSLRAAADASGAPFPNANALPLAELLAVRAGFAGLTLERMEERPRTHSSPDFPNVVFVVMDTLRADRTSTYGYERPTTPALDELANRGLVYENAYSTSSWTWPSTASLLTGLYPSEHGVLSNEACTLSSPLKTVAEAMQVQGWTTAGFACNPLIAANRGYDQGFERFEDVATMTAARDVMPDVMEWLRENSGSRFFLYLQLIDPHTPHDPDPDLIEQFVQATKPDFAAEATTPLERELFAGRDEFDVATYKLGKEDAPKGPDGKPAVDEILSAETQAWLSQIYDASVATGDPEP